MTTGGAPRRGVDSDGPLYRVDLVQRQLLIRRCRSCHAFLIRAQRICGTCLADEFDWCPAAGCGVVRAFRIEMPWGDDGGRRVTASVRLDEGVRLRGVLDAPADEVHVGMVVEVDLEGATGRGELRFRPERSLVVGQA